MAGSTIRQSYVCTENLSPRLVMHLTSWIFTVTEYEFVILNCENHMRLFTVLVIVSWVAGCDEPTRSTVPSSQINSFAPIPNPTLWTFDGSYGGSCRTDTKFRFDNCRADLTIDAANRSIEENLEIRFDDRPPIVIVGVEDGVLVTTQDFGDNVTSRMRITPMRNRTGQKVLEIESTQLGTGRSSTKTVFEIGSGTARPSGENATISGPRAACIETTVRTDLNGFERQAVFNTCDQTVVCLADFWMDPREATYEEYPGGYGNNEWHLPPNVNRYQMASHIYELQNCRYYND